MRIHLQAGPVRNCEQSVQLECQARAAVQVGWKHEKAVAELEAKRLAKAQKFYDAKKKMAALRAKAEAQVQS